MEEADDVDTIRDELSPVTPSALPAGVDTLAGMVSASPGTDVPSGSRGRLPPALASVAPVVLIETVQAADSSASGTSAVALFSRPRRVTVIASPSSAPRVTHVPTTQVTRKLR